ncbi:unnamed protein product [Urochloa humidicola]
MEAMDVKYKPLMFPNGAAVKKVKPSAVSPVVATAAGEPLYRECLKNHAASLGGHAVDGCGEFMPSPGANPADPTSLKCAACGCHRNFHRRAVEGSPPPPPPPAPLALPAPPVPPNVLHGHPHRGGGGGEETPDDRLPGVADDSDSDSDASEYDEERSVSPPPPHHLPAAPVAQQPPPPPPAYFTIPSASHMLLSLGGSGAQAAAQRLPPGPQAQLTPSSAPPHPGGGGAMPRKRFRTKFTAEQKQRMQELSERLGWRLQKRDEAIVDEWCRDIGVGKGVFKVWMHNNKHNFLGGHSARRSTSASAPAGAAPLHAPTANAGAGGPSFSPSDITPPPPVLTSSPPAATGFNINGAASSAPIAAAAGHSDSANGASSPQSA